MLFLPQMVHEALTGNRLSIYHKKFSKDYLSFTPKRIWEIKNSFRINFSKLWREGQVEESRSYFFRNWL